MASAFVRAAPPAAPAGAGTATPPAPPPGAAPHAPLVAPGGASIVPFAIVHRLRSQNADPLLVEDYAADGLQKLNLDSRRFTIHYTHCRIFKPGAVQPQELTRVQAWENIVTCYAEAYPDAASSTRSILAFGMVAKETHKDAACVADRSIHYHIIVFCDDKHYWRKVRSISASRYNIHLNAVAHDGYTSMYRYLKSPSKKKPLHELDQNPFTSPDHPEGDALQVLLQKGENSRKSWILGLQAAQLPRAEETPEVRTTFGAAFNWVVDKNLRGRAGALQLQADAAMEVKKGRPRLLEFVRKHRNDLQDQIAFIWEIVEAPKRLVRENTSRRELLLRAATATTDVKEFPAMCANKNCKCINTYESILSYQGVSSIEFRHNIYEALTAGRSKGNAVMLVGGKDSGKTTVTQAINEIFNAMPTPQSDSFCPLQNIRGYEVFLWQDLRYNPGHPSKDEVGLRIDEGTWNRLLEGLPTLIGVAKTDGSRSDFVFEEDTAFVFTGPFELTAWRNGRVDAKETDQISTRILYIHFSRPAPPRVGKNPKPCAFCWSRWVLFGELVWCRAQQGPLDDFMCKVAAALDPSVPAPKRPCVSWPPAAPAATAPIAAPIAPAGAAALASSAPSAGAGTSVYAGAPSAQGAPAANPASSAAPSAAGTSASPLFGQLASLMEWRAAGHLTEAEFAAAKRMVGLN